MIRIFSVFFLTLPYNAYCAVTYSESNGVYRIKGSAMNEPEYYDPILNLDPTFRLAVSENAYLEVNNFRPSSCTKNIRETLNKYLSGTGVKAILKKAEVDTFDFIFVCKATDKPGGNWSIYDRVPAPEKYCSFSVPNSVNFGEISMGSDSILKTVKASVTCSSRETAVTFSLSGNAISDGKIKVGDAEVSYAFDNGKTSDTIYAKKM